MAVPVPINLSNTTPAAPAGSQNVAWQGDSSNPRNVSASTPIVGGVSAKTANYSVTVGDQGSLLVANASTAITFTLPGTPPSAIFKVSFQNIGTAALVLSTTTLINGLTGSLSLAPGQGVDFFTDGTNYFTESGYGGNAAIKAPLEVDATLPTTVPLISKGFAGPTYVQGAVNAGNGTTSVSVAFPGHVIAGDVLLCFWYQSVNASPSVTDSLGNTWSQVAIQTEDFGIAAIYCYACTVASSGACTVTISGSRAIGGVVLAEYNGILTTTVDAGHGAWQDAGASPFPIGPITTVRNDLVVGYYFNNTLTTLTPPTGTTTRSNLLVSGASICLVDQRSAPGTYTHTWTFTGGTGTTQQGFILGFAASPQTADLFDFEDGFGTVLSSVNNVGQFVPAITSGSPTNTPARVGAIAVDPTAGKIWIWNGSAWNSSTFINPMTTVGDMIIGGGSGTPVRMAAGTLNYILTSNGPGNAPSWQVNSGGGGGGGVPLALQTPDYPPASPGALDDEFTDTTWNTNGKWTWANQVGATAAELSSILQLAAPGTNGVGASPSSIMQVMPSGAWTVTAKIFYQATTLNNNTCGGLTIRDSATDNQVVFFRGSGNGSGSQLIGILRPRSAWVQTSGFSFNGPLYMRVHDDGTTNRTYFYSFDGVNWILYFTEGRTTWTAHPNQVGLCLYADGNAPNTLGCDWFRSVP